ncbi:MAG: hypothetical protein AABW73_00005, partial [Nanoarchaeota archaeon]
MKEKKVSKKFFNKSNYQLLQTIILLALVFSITSLVSAQTNEESENSISNFLESTFGESCFFGNCLSPTQVLLSPKSASTSFFKTANKESVNYGLLKNAPTTKKSTSPKTTPKKSAPTSNAQPSTPQSSGSNLNPGDSCYGALSPSMKKIIDKDLKTLRGIVSRTKKAQIQAEIAGTYASVTCNGEAYGKEKMQCGANGVCPPAKEIQGQEQAGGVKSGGANANTEGSWTDCKHNNLDEYSDLAQQCRMSGSEDSASCKTLDSYCKQNGRCENGEACQIKGNLCACPPEGYTPTPAGPVEEPIINRDTIMDGDTGCAQLEVCSASCIKDNKAGQCVVSGKDCYCKISDDGDLGGGPVTGNPDAGGVLTPGAECSGGGVCDGTCLPGQTRKSVGTCLVSADPQRRPSTKQCITCSGEATPEPTGGPTTGGPDAGPGPTTGDEPDKPQGSKEGESCGIAIGPVCLIPTNNCEEGLTCNSKCICVPKEGGGGEEGGPTTGGPDAGGPSTPSGGEPSGEPEGGPTSGGPDAGNGPTTGDDDYVGCGTRAENAAIGAKNEYRQSGGDINSEEAAIIGGEAYVAACTLTCNLQNGGQGICKVVDTLCTCVPKESEGGEGGTPPIPGGEPPGGPTTGGSGGGEGEEEGGPTTG